MELDLDSEGGVHVQLAGINHRVFWLAQRKIKRHKEEWGWVA